MKYYEIVLMIHPDQSEKINNFITIYKNYIQEQQGSITRLEDWGRRQLSYPINRMQKAHYILINIMLKNTNNIIIHLEKKFKTNEFIMRYFIMQTKTNRITISSILKIKNERQAQNKRI
ncbi:30S ribosomal protein S6 [Enterobacteriaceae endosymbiont of Macroplea appendiculata]|uniref:30S ribosomal protein S6 n=1 Tax=Enterobacteriaceae endosymbiont of Macroplea appendiculata TaxID=2675790 RepID=UPI001449A998|nr:30S ribosomal protein S6 [Enterobacteriaceae endosymbiont of Macroplea appendiculata]QJC30938.1 30S ribosomal protein S6 [Enterobacteriaceae endosymbiont of Macroplea appendiculata]